MESIKQINFGGVEGQNRGREMALNRARSVFSSIEDRFFAHPPLPSEPLKDRFWRDDIIVIHHPHLFDDEGEISDEEIVEDDLVAPPPSPEFRGRNGRPMEGLLDPTNAIQRRLQF